MSSEVLLPSAQLKAAIEARNQTQRDAARALGITDAHMSDLCTGRARPSLDLAARIEAEYGIPMRAWAEVA